MTEERCPVCQAEFGNPGALGTHLSLTKDTAHVAHRAQAEGAAPALPAQAPAPPAPLLLLASGPVPNGVGAFGEAGKAGEVSQGEAQAGEAPNLFEASAGEEADMKFMTLAPPTNVEPLLPSGDAPGQAGAPAKAPPVSVPLEPILAGTVAISLNALFLNKPGDGKLTAEKVSSTGFPKAVEGSLRLYFPELPLDHPITALIASSAGLAMAVVELKAKNPEGEPPAPASAQATVRQAPPPAPPPPPASTGDPYWDSILRNQAGGVQA